MKVTKLKIHCEQNDCSLYESRNCIPCELRRENQHVSKIDVLFIGEAPGKTEVEEDFPFVGRSGQLLRRAIKYAKKEKLNIGFTNVVRCLPLNSDGEIRYPSRSEVGFCRGFLDRDIEKTDPDVIVLLGRAPLEIFPPSRDFSVSGERGNWRKLEIAGRERIVFSTWHPAYVGRKKNLLPILYDDIKMVFRLAGGWRPNPDWAKMGESTLLTTMKEVEEYIEFLRRGLTKEDAVATDVETKSLGKMYGNKIGMIQFTHELNSAMCIPLDHPKTPFDPNELEVIKSLLRRLFTRKVSFGYWLAHAGKYEQTLIGRHILGGPMNRSFKNVPMIDTLGMGYLLNENKTNIDGEKSYRLKLMARQVLQFAHYDTETLKKRAEGNLFNLPLVSPVHWSKDGWLPNLTDYGGMDVYVTKRLFEALKEEAEDQHYFQIMMDLLIHLFSPVYRLLSVIERNGFWANLAQVHMLKDPERSPILQRMKHIEKTEYRGFDTAKAANTVLVKQRSGGNTPLFGESWVMDINKPAHKKEWLINQCKLEPVGKTKQGEPEINKAFYAAHDGIPEVDIIKEHAGLKKLSTSYVNQLIEFLDPSYNYVDSKDGRIRANIHFAGTVTGRGASTKPNMQQQVKPNSPEKAAIKSIFQAEQPGVQKSFKIDFKTGPPEAHRPYTLTEIVNAIVQLDYMTNEVRWWCVLSGCPDLAKALNNGKKMRDAYRADPLNEELRQKAKFEGDLHRNTASLMYGVLVAEVNKDMRDAAKSIVFGWMFGRGNPAIAAQIGKSIRATEKLITQFGDSFPVGRDWLHGQPAIAQRHWLIESPIGRRRRLPGYLLNKKVWDDRSRSDWDDRRLVKECDRMAMNSGIQGIASDAAFIGASLFLDYIEDNDKEEWLIQNVVHDSCVNQIPIIEVAECVEVAEKIFTTDTMEYMTEHWGVDFPCPLEVDFEIGTKWGELMKWDGTKPSMSRIIEKLHIVDDNPMALSSDIALPKKKKKKKKKASRPPSHKLF